MPPSGSPSISSKSIHTYFFSDADAPISVLRRYFLPVAVSYPSEMRYVRSHEPPLRILYAISSNATGLAGFSISHSPFFSPSSSKYVPHTSSPDVLFLIDSESSSPPLLRAPPTANPTPAMSLPQPVKRTVEPEEFLFPGFVIKQTATAAQASTDAAMSQNAGFL